MTTTNRISLKMDEPNELKFQLRINGETSEPGATKPQVRFMLLEKENQSHMALVFPAGKTDDGLVLFSLPPLKDYVNSDTVYQGKVEVILGTRIFTPQTIEIIFQKDISVEVLPVKAEVKEELQLSKILEEVQDGHAAIDSHGRKKEILLTKSQLEKLIQEKQKKKAVAPADPKPASQPKKPQTSQQDTARNMFKTMLKDALKD